MNYTYAAYNDYGDVVAEACSLSELYLAIADAGYEEWEVDVVKVTV